MDQDRQPDTGNRSQGQKKCFSGLKDLGAYTRMYFGNEEELLESLSYDRLHIQRLKHQVILAKMRHTIENLPKQEELHNAHSRLIHEWVAGHILGEDILIQPVCFHEIGFASYRWLAKAPNLFSSREADSTPESFLAVSLRLLWEWCFSFILLIITIN
jgi:hemerythrin-like metal-binding protein